jgi:protein-S-isoprenylcysteine O-methyltransferase Ste14
MKPSFTKKILKDSSFIFLLSNFTLFILWIIFAIRHIKAYLTSPEANYIIIFILSEIIIALLFLFRKREKSISPEKIEWLLPLAATFLPLLFIPDGKIINLKLGINLLSLGVILQILAVISLNRSLGIVPAYREIKTSGLYRIIRHPMYLSYFFTYSGYLLVNISLFNIYLYLFTIFSCFLRIHIEENFLKTVPAYQKYAQKVKFKLLPLIY